MAAGRAEVRRPHGVVEQQLAGRPARDDSAALQQVGVAAEIVMATFTLILGAVALAGDFMSRMLRGGARIRGASGGGRRGGSKKGGNPLVIVVLVLWILSWILAPLVTRLLAMGVSRKREYLADAMSAQFTRNPGALANALHKIEHAAAPTSSRAWKPPTFPGSRSKSTASTS